MANEYITIQPPFTMRFREMSTPQLKAYFGWFMSVMPERVNQLAIVVRDMYRDWTPDLSVASLDDLGHWFESEVKTRGTTDAEKNALAAKLTIPIDVPADQLTSRTFSVAMDIGMYFGQLVLERIPGTSWNQPLKNKKFADYGQPVIMGFGTVPLNPVRIMVSSAYGIARGRDAKLGKLFEVWKRMKRPASRRQTHDRQ